LYFSFFSKLSFSNFVPSTTPLVLITTSSLAFSLTIDTNYPLAEIVKEFEDFSIVDTEFNLTIIFIVGDFVAEKPRVAVRIFTALRNIPLRMISYGGSSHNISLLVRQEEKIATLQAIQVALSGNNPQLSERVEGYELLCN